MLGLPDSLGVWRAQRAQEDENLLKERNAKKRLKTAFKCVTAGAEALDSFFAPYVRAAGFTPWHKRVNIDKLIAAEHPEDEIFDQTLGHLMGKTETSRHDFIYRMLGGDGFGSRHGFAIPDLDDKDAIPTPKELGYAWARTVLDRRCLQQ